MWQSDNLPSLPLHLRLRLLLHHKILHSATEDPPHGVHQARDNVFCVVVAHQLCAQLQHLRATADDLSIGLVDGEHGAGNLHSQEVLRHLQVPLRGDDLRGHFHLHDCLGFGDAQEI